MKRIIMVLCALSLVFGVSSASALQFTLDSYKVTLHDSDPGLVLYSTPILETTANFNLDVAGSSTFDLFKIGTTETYVNLFEDTSTYEISVLFDFSSPVASSSAVGTSRGRWLWQDGIVRWDNPTTFNFGVNGSFTIDLSDVHFGTPGSATVMATLTYDQATDSAPAPVPEPATLMLLGTGLVGIAGASRKKIFKKD